MRLWLALSACIDQDLSPTVGSVPTRDPSTLEPDLVTDTFRAPVGPDLLLVVDQDESMQVVHDRMQDGLLKLWNTLLTAGVESRFGVVPMYYVLDGTEDGNLGRLQWSAGVNHASTGSEGAQEVLLDLIDIEYGVPLLRTQGLPAAVWFVLENPESFPENLGFERGPTHVVAVSNANDQAWYPIHTPEFYDWLEPEPVTVDIVLPLRDCPESELTSEPSIMSWTAEFGRGTMFDLCDADWSAHFDDIAARMLLPHRGYTLSSIPADPYTMEVELRTEGTEGLVAQQIDVCPAPSPFQPYEGCEARWVGTENLVLLDEPMRANQELVVTYQARRDP